MADEQTYLVQSRPITTLHDRASRPVAPTVLLRGLAASSGRASGTVRVLTRRRSRLSC